MAHEDVARSCRSIQAPRAGASRCQASGSSKRAQAIDWAEKYPLPECGPIETAPVF